MSRITTHVLDTALGRPAAGIEVTLQRRDGEPHELSRSVTDADGRIKEFLPAVPLRTGSFTLTFHVAEYFKSAARGSFYERISIEFRVDDPTQHHHVPLLLSPYGYTTYRGS